MGCCERRGPNQDAVVDFLGKRYDMKSNLCEYCGRRLEFGKKDATTS